MNWNRTNLAKSSEHQKLSDEEQRALSSRYEDILAAIPDIIMEVDANKVYTWANQAGFDFFGEDVLGNEISFYFKGEQDTYERVQPIFDGDENVIYIENWQRRKDGEKRLLAWWYRVLKDTNGNVKGAISTARDITDRERSDIELKAIHQIYRDAIENAQGVPYRLDFADNKYNFIGEGVKNLLGVTADKLTFDKMRQLTKEINTFDTDEYANAIEFCNAFQNGDIQKYRADMKVVTPKGEIKWISDCSVPLRDEISNKVIGSIGILQDITKRKQAEEAVKESERFIRNSLNSLSANIAILDERGEIIFVNKSWLNFARANGLNSTFIGENYLAVCDRAKGQWSEEVPLVSAEIRKVISGEKVSFSLEYPCHSAEEFCWFHMSVNRFIEPGPVYVVVAHQNITDRMLTEDALRESEEKYRNLVERANDGIAIIQDLKIKYINPRLADILGYSVKEMIDTPADVHLHPDEVQFVLDRYKRRMAGEDVPSIYESALEHKDGRKIEIEINAGLINYQNHPADLIFVRDITKRKMIEAELNNYRLHLEELVKERTIELVEAYKELENEIYERKLAEREREKLLKQLSETEKMVILGQLTAAITHEINNPLDIIMTEIDAMEDTNDQNPELLDHIFKIKNQVYRINHISKNVLNYGKYQSPKFDLLEINNILVRVIELLDIYLEDHISVKTKLEQNLPLIQGDAIGLEIVFKNIILNAIESVQQKAQIFISTGLLNNDFLVVTIKDNGQGIDKKDLDRIFDPFYTTKRSMGGTGLGLGISAEIIKQHKGTIKIESKLGKGTTVKIELPVSGKASGK